jgi:hypothetical protein
MPVTAGAFDPIQARVYYSVTERIYNEPIQTPYLFTIQPIRFPYLARNGWETINQEQQKSAGQILIRFRRNSKSIRIDATMEIHHNGIIYGILTKNNIPSNERDEVEFLCQYKDVSTLFTDEITPDFYDPNIDGGDADGPFDGNIASGSA